MMKERKLRIMRNALNTILLEAKEPIIRVYAQSALDETVEITKDLPPDTYCEKHNWYGVSKEICPLCKLNQKL